MNLGGGVVATLVSQDVDPEFLKNLCGWVENSQTPGFHWDANSLKKELLFTDQNLTWIYKTNDHPLAAFVCYKNLGQVAEVIALATKPEAQRLGIMRDLLTKTIDVLSREPYAVKEVWLEVHAKNLAAQKLYEKLGFVKVGERRCYYRDGGDANLYSKSLP